MVVCMKSVQFWWQSLRNKISFLFISLLSSISSKLHEADCLVRPHPQKRWCAKKLISVANLGFCKIGCFDIDWDSKMPSSGCKIPTLVQKGKLHQIWKFKRTTNVKIQTLLKETIWMQNHIFNISFIIYRCILYLETHLIIYICIGIWPLLVTSVYQHMVWELV